MSAQLFCTKAIEAMRKISDEFHEMNVRFAQRITELEIYERTNLATEPQATNELSTRVTPLRTASPAPQDINDSRDDYSRTASGRLA